MTQKRTLRCFAPRPIRRVRTQESARPEPARYTPRCSLQPPDTDRGAFWRGYLCGDKQRTQTQTRQYLPAILSPHALTPNSTIVEITSPNRGKWLAPLGTTMRGGGVETLDAISGSDTPCGATRSPVESLRAPVGASPPNTLASPDLPGAVLNINSPPFPPLSTQRTRSSELLPQGGLCHRSKCGSMSGTTITPPTAHSIV